MQDLKEIKFHSIRPKQDEVESEVELGETVCYTVFGKHSVLEHNRPVLQEDTDHDLCYAYRSYTPTGWRHFIKQDGRGHFFNPFDIYNTTYNSNIKDRATGSGSGTRHKFQFKPVNELCFNLYLNFLRTKNSTSLTHAEREF